MRDFFIKSLELILNVVVVIVALGIIVAAGVALAGGGGAAFGTSDIGAAVLILVGGFVNLVLFAGFAYLGLGIYQNTKRTADLLEAQGRGTAL